MSVVTRFAPSPTGYLHIGGARTALFNWLYARHHGGRYRLRIEDTDRARSTAQAVAAIFDGLGWLGLDHDDDVGHQFERASRHVEIARSLLSAGKAYHCYATPEELAEMGERAKAEGRSMRYDGRWRDRDPAEAPPGVPPVIRFKAPQSGETVNHDLVQGDVRIANDELDDMVLLRADGTPTYMLSVVVDDHDMDITHVIRGDDHLVNAARQTLLFQALGWAPPAFAHIPLIHGPDGAKLSKRHGALALDAYKEMGILPEAMRNYLLRLGWSHGDDEIIDTAQAIAWFDLDAVGRSATRFDMNKLVSLNGHYLRGADDSRLVELIVPMLTLRRGHALAEPERARLERAMPGLKERAKNLVELSENGLFYVASRPIDIDDKAARTLDAEARGRLARLMARLEGIEDWRLESLEAVVRGFAEDEGVKLGQVAQPIRAALSGRRVSPGIFDVMDVLGRQETLARLGDVVTDAAATPSI